MVDLPTTIQENLVKTFELEKRKLHSEIDALRQEIENSQQAFDKYRERARTSLKKAGNDHQLLEKQVDEIKEQLKIEKNNGNIENQSNLSKEDYINNENETILHDNISYFGDSLGYEYTIYKII